MSTRVLVTGSRDWTSENTIGITLMSVTASLGADDDEITLVSGACPTGADAMAEHVAERMGWKIERHPAQWEVHGTRAGFVRNQAMVDAGADVCVAYIRRSSRGATMTAQLAENAGIPVHTYREES